MVKPLLSDELLERLERGEDLTDLIDQPVTKSRRQAQEKRNNFQRRLNLILWLLLALFALLLYAIFNW